MFGRHERFRKNLPQAALAAPPRQMLTTQSDHLKYIVSNF